MIIYKIGNLKILLFSKLQFQKIFDFRNCESWEILVSF